MDTINVQYEVVKSLKKSSRGTVSLIRNRSSGKRYVFRQFVGNSTVYKKLLNISSPNLPQIFEVAQQDGNVAVLEEYIQGDTLSFILEGGLLPQNQARQIMSQLCNGLYVLHSVGAVHRDIKPENVMIRVDQAVLIDFDSSRVVKTECINDTQVLGTTGYAAPEQYGISQTGNRADIYSMGVLLNVMLTGEHPSKCLAKGRMGRIVQRCTMMSPEKRYKDVIHLIEAL